MIYFDTSALVKRYVNEPGSERVSRLVAKADYAAVSVLAYAELLAALARKEKARELTAAGARKAGSQFETDWRSFLVADFQAELLPLVKKVIDRQRLTGADSVHLATALWLKARTGLEVSFAAADNALLHAAEKENLRTISTVEDD